MLNFIVYEDEEKFRDKYFSVIDKFLGGSNLAHRIIELKKYGPEEEKKLKKLDGARIYILDIEVPGKSGLDFAREIRQSGDWISQIIIVTSHDDLKNFDYQTSMLMLAFISKFYNLETELLSAINKAHLILTSLDTISFQKNSKIYNVPINEILYFEKVSDDNYCQVITTKRVYETNKTPKQWEEILSNDPRFMRTHRSYIVNLYNVINVDLEKDEIIFMKNKKVLLSRNYKKELKKRISRTLIKEE